MIVRRIPFFMTLFGILFIAFLPGKLIWLMHARRTTGVFYYQERGNALEQFRKVLYEVYFQLGKDTVWFKGEGTLSIKPGTLVTILYQPQHPTDAKIDKFVIFWGSTVVYGGIPFVVLLAIFLHPEIVPRGASLRLTVRKPFFQLV